MEIVIFFNVVAIALLVWVYWSGKGYADDS